VNQRATPPPGIGTAVKLLQFVWTHPENRGKRLRAIGRLVGWQIWKRVVRRPWDLHLAPEITLRCQPRSTAASGVIYCRYPEWQDMRFLLAYLRSGDIILDVGANIGTYSLLAASIPGTRVWAFEPSTLACERHRENILLNALQERISLVQRAVGVASGFGFLTLGKDTVNSLVERAFDELMDDDSMEAVGIVSLDDYFGGDELPAALIKVDVEGREGDVLLGARQLILRSSPALIIECNHLEELRKFLVPLGYHRYEYEPDSGVLRPVPWEHEAANNLLALKDVALTETRLLKPWAAEPWPTRSEVS